MDIKSIIFFLLLIYTISCKSLAIQIFSNDDKLIQSKELKVKNDSKGMTTTEDASSVPSENIEEPADHKIPYSEHEDPKDVPTKPKFIAPGEWAKPSKDKNISLDFIPTKVYAQVRGTHTVKHAPREEAIKEAETDDEKLNALRLREVVKNSKVNTVYTEEGYEDSAYDHAGQIRDADFHEGFARKLKNRLKEKHNKEEIDSDELADYENDYRDHDENDKEENSRENYLESNLNPKLIVRNEIKVLEKDVEQSGEEIADSSNIRSFDSKKLQKSTNSDSKLATDNEISNTENVNQDFGENESQNEEIYTSNPTDRVKYETTNHPEQTIVDRSKENLSTNDYGQAVWNFLKMPKNLPINEQEITLNSKGTTTLSPNFQLFTMMPYFTSTIEETVTLPSIYSVSQTFLPRGLDSEIINTGQITSITQNNDQIWPKQTNGVNYVERNDNPTIRSVISDSGNFWNPLIVKKPDRSSLKNYDEYVLNNTSTESATTIIPKKNQTEILQSYAGVQINDKDKNSFSNSKTDRKKTKYKISVRHKPGKLPKTSKSLRSRKENDANKYERNLNDQRAKYMKVLNYVMNQDRSKESDDFTVARGPNEVKYFDFRMEDRPIASSQLAIVDQSSVPIESETIMRESNGKNFPRNRPISSVDNFLGTSSLPIYKIDTYPFIDLSPPPLPSTKHRNKYRSISFPYNNNDRYYRNNEPIIKYSPVIVDLTRKSRTRRKRSMEYVKGMINNATTNRYEINQNNNDNIFRVMKDRRNSRVAEGSRNKNYYEERLLQRNIANSRGNRKTHEELLNYSPKVSTLVVDKEIEERFNKDIEQNHDDKLKNDENDKPKVEVEVPSFDYIEELANQKVEQLHQSVTEATIDFNKYPFYKNERISDLSGLKYALDPRNVPRKTSTGMEFYDSRDTYKNCEEVDADLDEVHPKEEKPSNDRDPSEHEPRLRGLGEKLDCFKAKYFDENPFDNPLFMEKNVGDPNLPTELDPKKLTERVLVLPIGTSKEYIPQKLSKKPERNYYHPYTTRNSKGHIRGPKNQQKKERISTSLEISKIPYQKQVYEDVMNNIKESTDIYRNHRMTTINPISLTNNESTVLSTDQTNVKTYDKVFTNKTNLIDIETDSNTTTIDGLLPPRGANNFGRINNPRRNRMTRKSRRRPPLYHVPRTIKRYHKIKIQKRSLKKQIDDSKLEDLIAEESRDIINKKPDTSLTTFKSRRRKSSIVSKNLTSLRDDPDKDSSSRIVYTIRDRIKHSKPKDELRDVGKFTAESRILDEDNRRKEPRYNNIERKRNSYDSSSTTVSTILSTILSIDDSDIDESTTPSTIPNKRLKYSTLTRDKTRKDPEEHPSEKESITKQKTNYEVRENIEDISTTPRTLSTSLKYSEVRDYITSDPPEYKEIFSEKATESPIVEETRSKEPKSDLEEDSKSSERYSQESEEDSSEKEKVSEEEEENEGSKESIESEESKEEDRTFFHYSSRPYSPSENYEDMKYSELGPRINKPAFYHPPFSMLGYERSNFSPFEDNSEETFSGENKRKKTRYASFPWSSEDEGRKQSFGESKDYSIPIWNYEYPWEKKERLAKERRGKNKNYERFDDFHSKDSNEDVSSSNTRAYPWDLYDVSSKKHKGNKQESYFDTDESSSVHKPIKYSSKYNSNNFKSSQSNENNVNHVLFDPKKLNKNETQTLYSNSRRILPGTLIKPEDITLAPRKETEKKREKVEEKNFLEVTSVSTIEEKNLKNATKKDLRNEQMEFTTLQSLINMETTTKSNVTGRFIDKSRRRRIIKTNSTINNDEKEYSTKRKEQMKKRKIRSTTITPTTTRTTTIIPTFAKSIRRRPQMKSQETNNQLFSKIKDILPTPSTTTVEHRSRVSKESFIRTTYPDNENSTTNINENPKTSKLKYYDNNNEKDRNRENITSENIERISLTTKETPDHVYRTKQIDKDGVKKMFISIEPNKAKNISQLENSDISEFDKEDNWKISQDLIPSTESYLIGNPMEQTLEPYSRNDRKFEDGNIKLKKIEKKDEKEEEEKEENIKIESSIKFIHHPEQRLYYYLEQRR